MRGGANLPLVSNYNRGVILEAIRAGGPVSRVELSSITGLTPPTVSNIVRRLMEHDLVVRSRAGPVHRGQAAHAAPAEPLRPLRRGRPARVRSHHLRRDRSRRNDRRPRAPQRRRPERPSAVVARIAEETKALLRETGLDFSRVVGVGVASPGPLDHARGVILTPRDLTHWRDFPLRDELTAAVGYPVLVDNDATAAAMGESWVGSTGTARNFACVYTGAGIGSGVVVDGQIHRGASSNAGEIGHISVDADGERCFCGNRGCLELYSSPRAVVTAARSDESLAKRLGLGTTSRSLPADFARVCDAAVAGCRTRRP